ncbi:MAG: hypothetical protein ACLTWC_10745, partial [Bifidobacterium breve]
FGRKTHATLAYNNLTKHTKARRPYRLASERLWAWTAERLRRGWSPLPICGRLRLEHPGDETMRCCPETLYRWVLY